jgi:hypothetical protein
VKRERISEHEIAARSASSRLVDDSASGRDVAAGKRQSQQQPVEMTRVDLYVGQEYVTCAAASEN